MVALQRIWLLRGWAGSGKDTVAALLRSKLPHAEQSSFASAVKDEVAAMYEFERAYLDTQEGKARKIQGADGHVCTLRDLIIAHAQSEKIRHDDPHIWARRVTPSNETQDWILSDWRFPEELKCLKERFPFASIHTIHIVRHSVTPLDTDTEHRLDDISSQYTIHNSGTLQDLETEIEEFLSKFFNKTNM